MNNRNTTELAMAIMGNDYKWQLKFVLNELSGVQEIIVRMGKNEIDLIFILGYFNFGRRFCWTAG